MTTPATSDRPSTFAAFSPTEYLATYYTAVQEDEELLMGWLVDHARPFLARHRAATNATTTLLDIGCGPTVHHVLPLADLIDRAVLTDLVPGNLAEVERWLRADGSAHDWTPFVRACARLLHADRDPLDEGRLDEGRLARRVRRITEVGPPLDLTGAVPYPVTADVVTTFFCPCSATGRADRFAALLRRVTQQLRPGGAFLGSFLGGCSSYRVGGQWYPSPDLAFVDLATALDRAGIDVGLVQRLPTLSMGPDGFDHIFVASGVRRC
jgi:NNMT/PNMT/TEMT family